MSKGQAGKGDSYRPVDKKKFDEGYERAFGKKCMTCQGRGYHWDDNGRGKMAKTACLVCNGTGRLKGTS